MRSMICLTTLTLCALFVVAGCDDGSQPGPTGGGGGGGGRPAITIDELGREEATNFCRVAASCCESGELQRLVSAANPPPANEAECAREVELLFNDFTLPGLKEAIAAGRLEFDGVKAASCFDKYPEGCSVIRQIWFDMSSDCEAMLVGKVQAGGECKENWECADEGSICVGEDGERFGKCQATPGAVGAACQWNDECASNYCQSQVCTAQLARGETCQVVDECSDGHCDTTTFVCSAGKNDGASCGGWWECESGDCDETTSTCVTICNGK